MYAARQMARFVPRFALAATAILPIAGAHAQVLVSNASASGITGIAVVRRRRLSTVR